jgi:M6 family metalloprotease-like protein
MKPTKSTLIAALALGAAISMNAKPARPGNRTITQPDGSTLTIHTVGNAFCHYTLTDDNKLLVSDNHKYCYATINADGTLASTGMQAHDSAARPAAEADVAVDISATASVTNPTLTTRRRANAQTGVGRYAEDFPTEGTIHGLLILVEFTDESFKDDSFYPTSAKEYFTNMMRQDGFSELNGTGSAKDYFNDVSMNKFNLDCDVVGPYTVSKGYAYYGENNSNGYDKYAYQMVTEACKLADADVDFSKYDNDGDGYCDFVYVIYAGIGASDGSDENANRIWAHSDYLSSHTKRTTKLDGVIIDKYACSNEWENGQPDGVGTFVHEFSHVMGLPDLYYTGSGTFLTCTPGDYDILDIGCYNNDSRTPPSFSAYERNAMGWIDLKELADAENVTLQNIADSNEACIIKTTTDTEFYLLENRQQTGWDTYIPNTGMLIWHIDGTQSVYKNNTVNNTKSHQYVDLVEANGRAVNTSSTITKGWPWPGTSGKTEFTSTTSPALKDWSGNAIDVPITEITETTDGLVTFKVNGGAAGVNDITVDTDDEQTEYYNLQGIRVLNPQHGIFIVRNGKSASVKKL